MATMDWLQHWTRRQTLYHSQSPDYWFHNLTSHYLRTLVFTASLWSNLSVTVVLTFPSLLSLYCLPGFLDFALLLLPLIFCLFLTCTFPAYWFCLCLKFWISLPDCLNKLSKLSLHMSVACLPDSLTHILSLMSLSQGLIMQHLKFAHNSPRNKCVRMHYHVPGCHE